MAHTNICQKSTKVVHYGNNIRFFFADSQSLRSLMQISLSFFPSSLGIGGIYTPKIGPWSRKKSIFLSVIVYFFVVFCRMFPESRTFFGEFVLIG